MAKVVQVGGSYLNVRQVVLVEELFEEGHTSVQYRVCTSASEHTYRDEIYVSRSEAEEIVRAMGAEPEFG